MESEHSSRSSKRKKERPKVEAKVTSLAAARKAKKQKEEARVLTTADLEKLFDTMDEFQARLDSLEARLLGLIRVLRNENLRN